MISLPPQFVHDVKWGDMELTPEQIANAQFVGSVRGYNREDVDAFLQGVADDYQRLLEELRGLRSTAEITRPSFDRPTEHQISGSTVATPEEAPPVMPTPTNPEPPTAAEPVPAPEPSGSTGPDAEPFEDQAATVVTVPASQPDPPHTPPPAAQPGSPVVASPELREILLAADAEAWRIRDEIEEELEHSRAEIQRSLETATRKADEVRDDARQKARTQLDSDWDIVELAQSISDQLRDADGAANTVLRAARVEARERRRAVYDRLATAEARARAVIDDAHNKACGVLRDVDGNFETTPGES